MPYTPATPTNDVNVVNMHPSIEFIFTNNYEHHSGQPDTEVDMVNMHPIVTIGTRALDSLMDHSGASEEDEHDREGSYHIIKFAVQQEFAHTMNSHLSSTELDFRDHSYKCEIINEEVSTLEEACDAADWEQANECSDNEIVLVGDGYNTPRYNAFNQSYFDGTDWFSD